jgi:hypothetical protein
MNKYSTSFKVSLWLACILTLGLLAFNLGHDVLPGVYYVGGPGLTSHTFTGSEYAPVNTVETGLIVICHLLAYLFIAAIEGLIVWFALYWLYRLLMSPGSPVAPESMALPSFAAKTPLSPPPAS